MVAQAGGQPVRLGPASVTDTDGRVFVADGQLQDALIPPRWGYAGRDGSFAVFVDHFASGPLRLQAIPGRPAPGASVRRVAGSAAAPAAAAVFSPHGVRVIRSVAAMAGWSAIWHPRHGRAAPWPCAGTASSRPSNVPAGRGVVTWRYRPPGFRMGFALSLGATALILLALIGALFVSRSRRRHDPAAPSGSRPRARRPSARPGPSRAAARDRAVLLRMTGSARADANSPTARW